MFIYVCISVYWWCLQTTVLGCFFLGLVGMVFCVVLVVFFFFFSSPIDCLSDFCYDKSFGSYSVIALPKWSFCPWVLRSSKILSTMYFQVSQEVGESSDNQLPGQSKCCLLTSYYKNITHITYLIFMTDPFLSIHSSTNWIWLFQKTPLCLTVFLWQVLGSIKLKWLCLSCFVYFAMLN